MAKTKNPYEAIGAKTWLRGIWLGVALIGMFIVGAGLVFLGLGLVGLDAAHSLFWGLVLGPVVGTVMFVMGWRYIKPRLTPAKHDG